MMEPTLLQITAPYFVAGAIVQAGVVVRAAPIIKYMRGWPIVKVEAYAGKKGWIVYQVEQQG